MSKPIIEVKGISKCYKLGSIGAQTMRDEVEAFFARFKKTKSPATSHSLPATAPTGAAATSHSLPNSARSAEFWALRDVSFDVQPGEVVGIIGRNGAGKSTLLKILSRITEPTSGEIRVRGRIASLLEVGTGFHPELSGRENIFLNGAILGMTKAEIRSKFDEIVDFAGVEQFIDTPVKRYSSGMYVRLAFAVAAHLEPEILIVDEVLAVGDAEFQKKCLGKMKDVAGHGRTILFVSHNMAAIQSLCSVCVLLENGKISLKETPRSVARKYFSNSEGASFKSNKNLFKIAGLTSVYISDASGRKIHSPITSDEFHFVIEWKCEKVMPNLKVGIGINSEDGTRIVGSIPEDSSIQTPIGKGNFRALVAISRNTLLAQKYQIDVELWVKGGESLDFLQPALVFEVQPGESMILLNDPERKGFLQFLPKWSFYNYE